MSPLHEMSNPVFLEKFKKKKKNNISKMSSAEVFTRSAETMNNQYINVYI